MKINHTQKDRGRRQAGFTLLELMASLAILSIVMAVAVEGLKTIQVRNTSDTNKVALTQESRQFMDQILWDLRQSGYPSMSMFVPATLAGNPATNCAPAIPNVPCCNLDLNVACGLVSFSSTQIEFEADLDGSGVSQIYLQLAQTVNGGTCTVTPCVLRRGTVYKAVGGVPNYYTELNNVNNTSIFTATKYDGTAYNPPADNISSVKNIGITLYVQAPQPDPGTSVYPTVTMASEVRINNGSQDQ